MLAGIGVILPLFVVLEAALIAFRRLDLALRWGAGFGVCLVGTYILKWLDQQADYPPMFPSGHVSMAVYTYGGLAFLLLARDKRSEIAGVLIVAIVGLFVGLSRVEITRHNWFDVCGGIALGIACLPLVGCPRRWPVLAPRARIALAIIFAIALIPVLRFGPILDSRLHRIVAY